MNENLANQLGGLVRVLVPLLLTGAVSYGLMEQSAAEALTEPLTLVIISVAGITAAGAAAWSVRVNTPTEIVKSAAKVEPEGVKVVVGPLASETMKVVAADPKVPGVVRGSV